MSDNKAGVVVRNLLLANSALAALVGTRIYPDEAPAEADFPLIVYGVRLQDREDGTALICPASIDVHCYASTDDTAEAVAVAADSALQGAGGSSGNTSVWHPTLEDWSSVRDADMAIWARMLRYGATVVRSS